jgi:sugar phosphate isomerase/epimerase
MPNAGPDVPVALQMYSVREEAARDFTGTLKAVATIGYTALELSGYGDLTAAELRRVLDGLGLVALANHVSLPTLRSALDRTIDECLALGCRYLVCPWLPEDERGDATAYRRLAAELTSMGRRCRERELGFAYHNHDFEFARLDGRYALDVLLEATNAQVVRSELDVYWAYYAGVDPAQYLRNLGSRCAIVHLKDMVKDDSRTFAEVGEGRLDFPPIFAAGKAAGVEFYVVEQDRCQRPPLESIALSLQHLRSWGIAC